MHKVACCVFCSDYVHNFIHVKQNAISCCLRVVCVISVATAIADIFRNNGISVGNNLGKILKKFEKIDEAKSRGVI